VNNNAIYASGKNVYLSDVSSDTIYQLHPSTHKVEPIMVRIPSLNSMDGEQFLLNLEGTKKYLRGAKNASVVGNPIRSGFSSINRSQARKHLGIGENETLIISFGGSLGASKLNEAVMEMINKYTFGNVKVRHIHSTGKKHFETAKKAFPNLYSTDSRVKIVPYIENMPLLLTAADLAITRSGAMTIAELCRSGTPSILIPSPNVTANHQYVNARYLKDIGAAELIEEKDLTADTLFRSLNALLDDKNLRFRMAKRAREAYPENTSRIITNLLKKLTNE
jgi:UDP-N-acetylglucosamine--N-acetylmuramyl-(pentapeptide) pyrophosphoryl-undecaprenol N-acetylglucosamine transferase